MGSCSAAFNDDLCPNQKQRLTATDPVLTPSPHGLLTFPNACAVRLTYVLFYWPDCVSFVQSNVGLCLLLLVMQSEQYLAVYYAIGDVVECCM